MFTKLGDSDLATHWCLFNTHPKLALFANAAKFELDRRVPNHPCDFYTHTTSRDTMVMYCFRHDKLPDANRPILMVAAIGGESSDVRAGLRELRMVEPALCTIQMVMGERMVVKEVVDELFVQFGFRPTSSTSCYNFYVPRVTYPTCADFEQGVVLGADLTIRSLRVDDVELVNATWKFATPRDVLQQREKIERLPSVGVSRGDSSPPIAFEFVGLHGQFTHQYTVEEFRNMGLGTIVERVLIAKCIRENIIPIKCVEVDNEIVLKRSLKSTIWRKIEENIEDQKVEFLFDYINF